MAGAHPDPNTGPASPASPGFTLLEVLVAFAIAVPALALLFNQGITSVSTTRTSALYQEAISRAQSRLAAVSDHPAAGERSGDDGDGFHWQTRIVPVGTTAPPRQTLRGSPYAAGSTLYAITVVVSWPGTSGFGASGTRAVTLDTRRLGPARTGGP